MPTFAIATIYYVEHSTWCGDARDRIRRFAFHVFFLPFVVDSMVSCSRRGSASRFFRTPTSTRAGRILAIRLQLTKIMQTSASIQRTAQLRPFSISTASVKAWLNGKSMFYTTICEFEGIK